MVALITVAIVAHFSRGRRVLERWADRNFYTLVSAEHRFWMKGPFFFRSNNGNAVYYIVVQNTTGGTKRGFARCGSFWWGMWLSDEVTVEWDDPF